MLKPSFGTVGAVFEGLDSRTSDWKDIIAQWPNHAGGIAFFSYSIFERTHDFLVSQYGFVWK